MDAPSCPGCRQRDLRIAEVAKLDMKVEGGKIVAYRALFLLSFKYDA